VTEEELSPKLFGAATDPQVSTHADHGTADLVAVYFPMSYQIGGYTLYIHKSELQEEGMRLVLIGGVTSSAERYGRS
jgi:hypothetical protein